MSGLEVMGAVMNVTQIGLTVAYVRARTGGVSPRLLLAMFAPAMACSSVAMASLGWMLGHPFTVGMNVVATALWLAMWWSQRPPRPPRRRVLRAAEAGR